MKNKLMLITLITLPILLGCEIRHAAVYVEPRQAIIIAEPVTEVVIIEGRPVRRVVVVPRPIIVHRHH